MGGAAWSATNALRDEAPRAPGPLLGARGARGREPVRASTIRRLPRGLEASRPSARSAFRREVGLLVNLGEPGHRDMRVDLGRHEVLDRGALTERRSAPRSSRCVAKLWRSVCGVARRWMPAAGTCLATMFSRLRVVSRVPRWRGRARPRPPWWGRGVAGPRGTRPARPSRSSRWPRAAPCAPCRGPVRRPGRVECARSSPTVSEARVPAEYISPGSRGPASPAGRSRRGRRAAARSPPPRGRRGGGAPTSLTQSDRGVHVEPALVHETLEEGARRREPSLDRRSGEVARVQVSQPATEGAGVMPPARSRRGPRGNPRGRRDRGSRP